MKLKQTELQFYKNQHNCNDFPKEYEQNLLPSETIPDQSMSLHEIMRRFASGLPLGGQRVPEYDGEDDLLEGINPKTLDLSEIHQIRIEFAEELKSMQVSKVAIPKVKQLSIDDVETIIENHYQKSLLEKTNKQIPPLP